VARSPVTVVVASRDRPEMVDRCLASVRAALSEPGDELVLVDSASGPAAATSYAETAARHRAKLVRVDRAGVNLARNHGWRAGSAPLVLFTDDDVEVEPGWADAYAASFRAHPEAAFLTGWIAPPEEGEQDDVAVIDSDEPRVLDRHARGVLGHGASIAVRREALVAIDGWDEAMGAGSRFRAAPEVDLFDRLLHSGRTGRYEPTARARHHQWRTAGQLARLHFRYGLGTGARLAKLARYDRRRLRHAAREAWWEWGVRDLWLATRSRHERRMLIALLRMAGFVVGFLDALGTPVESGHFRPRVSRGGRRVAP
jgi:glycosyltransferase involved in cell wall biosynthesis